MKIFCASIDHETNRFSPIPTSITSYQDGFLYRPSTGEGSDKLARLIVQPGMLRICRERGHELIVGVIAAAHPSAPTVQKDYELLRDELLNNLSAALPVDCIVLRLHGAMVAEGYDDCEGDVLHRIRDVVGADTPVGVLFDLHGNVTDDMVRNASVLMACKEYPHTDFSERAAELIELMERTASGECSPTTSFSRVPMTGLFQTTRQPLRGLVDEIFGMETDREVLSVSLTHGFFWADMKDVGAGVLVVTDNAPEQACELSLQIADRFFAMRESIATPLLSLDEALRQASACPPGPVVLADRSDNPGGGAAADATFILQQLLERDIKDVAIGMFWDPMAVELAIKAGIGAQIPIRIGGKMGPMSGSPIDLDATVIGVSKDHWQWAMGARDDLGEAVAIEADGIQLVLCSTRQQVLSPECFTELGVSLSDKRLVVVKSAQHFAATFGDITEEIVYVGMPGTVSQDYDSIPYNAIPRPLWPLDSTPFKAFDRDWR